MLKVIIAGRTRTGKTRLAEHLAKNAGMKILKTCTDRPRRWPGEDTYKFYDNAAQVPDKEKLFLTTGLDSHQRWTNKSDLLASDVAIMDFEGVPEAIRIYRANGHRTMLIYAFAPEKRRRMMAIKDAAAHGQDMDTALLDFEDRNKTESSSFDKAEARIKEITERAAADGTLYPNATPMVESMYGEDYFLDWRNGFDPDCLDRALMHVLSASADALSKPDTSTVRMTYGKPVTANKADYDPETWNAICLLLGLEPEITERVNAHLAHVDAELSLDKEPPTSPAN